MHSSCFQRHFEIEWWTTMCHRALAASSLLPEQSARSPNFAPATLVKGFPWLTLTLSLSSIREGFIRQESYRANVYCNIPGIHEIRKTMRHQTHAHRVAYGTAILTFWPSFCGTQPSWCAVCLRSANLDPAILGDHTGRFQSRERPIITCIFYTCFFGTLTWETIQFDLNIVPIGLKRPSSSRDTKLGKILHFV